jgi:hypothetical protein
MYKTFVLPESNVVVFYCYCNGGCRGVLRTNKNVDYVNINGRGALLYKIVK